MNSSSAALFKDHANFRKREADAASFLHPVKNVKKLRNHHLRHKKIIDQNQHLVVRKHLQDRFLSGTTDAITLDEIIQESELVIESSDKHWLASEALLSNEKIDVKKVEDVNKFVYKPPLDLKGGKKQALLNLLKSRHEKCEGAVTVDDVRDTIPKPKADKIIESLIKDDQVVKVTSNKKEILFYTDPSYKLKVHPDFTESWRKISVEGLDDKKIWEFLDKQGHYGLMKNTPRQSH
ncbi:unnamed protein product, partial [Rotaria magnacalcarata]